MHSEIYTGYLVAYSRHRDALNAGSDRRIAILAMATLIGEMAAKHWTENEQEAVFDCMRKRARDAADMYRKVDATMRALGGPK